MIMVEHCTWYIARWGTNSVITTVFLNDLKYNFVIFAWNVSKFMVIKFSIYIDLLFLYI